VVGTNLVIKEKIGVEPKNLYSDLLLIDLCCSTHAATHELCACFTQLRFVVKHTFNCLLINLLPVGRNNSKPVCGINQPRTTLIGSLRCHYWRFITLSG